MIRYRLTVEYDGTRYGGWQVQPNAPTIQGRIEEAAERLSGSFQRVYGAGRTDAGVHARGQVATVLLPGAIPQEKVALALNSRLPKDIVIRDAVPVADDFDPRRDAKRKLYRYTIHAAEIRPAIGRQYCWSIRRPLDLDAMRQACAFFVGEHDYTSFAQQECNQPEAMNTRAVDRCEITSDGAWLTIDVEGRSFLYNMVRNIVGTLVDVGHARFTPAQIPEIFAAKSRAAAGQGAPACGLCLEWIHYEEVS